MQRVTPTPVRKLFNRLSRNRHRAEPFENVFHYRPDDVVIVSYPRSGSTWLRFIMAHLIHNMIPGEPKEVDFLRTQLIVPEISEEAHRKGADFETLPSPRIMRSHSLYNSHFPNVVYLMRDGRDVLVSYYYYFKKFQGFEGTLYEFLRCDARRVEWDEHVNSWIYQNPSLSNVYVIRYENMLRDPFQEVEELAHFIGLERTAEQMRKAIEGSDFHTVRQIEERKGLGYTNAGNPKIRFIRKGGSGNWRDEVGEREKALIKQRFGNALIRTGYESSFQW